MTTSLEVTTTNHANGNKKALNPAQQEFVQSYEACVMVQAGAGTGKTAAAVEWVVERLNNGVLAKNILMLTFTKKAANEMLERVKSSTQLWKGITAGTFHSFSAKILRIDPCGFGFSRSVSILDENMSADLWKSVVTLRKIKLNNPSLGELRNYVSYLRNRGLPISSSISEKWNEKKDELLTVVNMYNVLKKNNALVDFDDLLTLLRDRLLNDSEFAKHMRDQFEYVLVDEIQDNNIVQHQIIEYLAPKTFVGVGDRNQSIYHFRGAVPELMANILKLYPHAKWIKFEINYRSGQNILDVANQIIAESAYPLELKAAGKSHSETSCLIYSNENIEGESVAQDIKEKILSGVPPTSIAVLSRSGRTLNSLEFSLGRLKVPFVKYGGQKGVDASEVRDFISIMRLIENPRDIPSFMRAATLFQSVGEAAAIKAMAADDILEALPKQAQLLNKWICAMRTMNFAEACQFLFEQIKEAKLLQINYKEDSFKREFNLDRFVEHSKTTCETLREFIDSFLTDKLEKEHLDTAITLSTIHSAKGLEWEYVYVVGVGDSQIPSPRATDEDMQEEIRLFYVAATRAKKKLVLTFPRYLNNVRQKQSRFLPEGITISDLSLYG